MPCRCPPGTEHAIDVVGTNGRSTSRASNANALAETHGRVVDLALSSGKQFGTPAEFYSKGDPACFLNMSCTHDSINHHTPPGTPPISPPTLSEAQPNETCAYLVAPAERAKVGKTNQRAAGIKPKRKPRIVEDHYDDLGDDLTDLNDDLAFLAVDIVQPPWTDSESDHPHDLDAALARGHKASRSPSMKVFCFVG